ncbi:hypothetical protein HCC75_12910 (plasmid) [Levilactobacillus brevis]|nr:hypothetical protein HCC75_12910 [Levilactobacillus brevis]
MTCITLQFAHKSAQNFLSVIVTTLSVVAAVSIGFVELLQVVRATFKFNGSFWSWVQGVNLNWLGFALVALFIALWGLFYLIWKATRQRRLNTDL